MPPTSPARWAFAALLLGNVALAFGPWLVRLAGTDGGVGPVAAAFWRVALAVPLLLVLARVARQPFPRLAAPAWIALAAGGLFFAGDLGAWHLGILQTRLANATLFANVASFFFAGYGFLIARRLPGRVQAAALLLAAGGVALLMGRSYDLSPDHVRGDLLCIVAALFYTGYLVVVGRARDHMQPLPVLAIVTAATVLPLWLAAWALGEPILPSGWSAVLLLAIGSQVIGQGLLVYAVGHLSPLVVGVGLLVQPVVAAATGWIAFDERLDRIDVAGAVLIAVALVLVRARPAPASG